jgi:hypothetical protein
MKSHPPGYRIDKYGIPGIPPVEARNMSKFRLYIDEVGNPDLGNCENPNHRFLSLTGVIIDIAHVQDRVHPDMEALKSRYFNSHPDDPYHYCLAILLERFNFWLNRRGTQGDVIGESRGGKEDIRLKKSFAALWEKGTEYVEPRQFQATLTSRELKVKPKTANIAGLQLADLIAHPSRCEILAEQGLLGRALGPFAQQIIGILQEKYDCEKGRIYGKKFLQQ